jgi:lipopolysaccharide/colanic/teichoic acid biosynthesis glycosyltransferase
VSYRLRDILIAATALLLLALPMALIALALACSQERVLFAQLRTGYRRRPFRMYKFSTLRDLGPGEREEDAQRYRLTPVGRWLRRFSLDELPQLWHVVRGDMALVGPRPLIHDYLPLYSPDQLRRFDVRPGITGWAQIKGRNSLRFTERFALDQWYVAHRSHRLDLRILGMTLGKAVRGQGVYADRDTTAARFDGHN